MNLYIYPWGKDKREKPVKDGSPYLEFLGHELGKHYRFLNENDRSTMGFLHSLKYLLRIDLLVLNWVEDLPDRRFGKLQVIAFFFVVFYLKMFRKKVVWIMHNRVSHDRSNEHIKLMMTRTLLNHSNVVVVHARDGLEYAASEYHFKDPKLKFTHHPMMKKTVEVVDKPKNCDILIWGKMTPYKGVDAFLKWLTENALNDRYRIVLAGEISPPDYEKRIRSLISSRIQILNRYIEDDELTDLMARSRVVLFTYRSDTILSSAALMDSLAYGIPIVGPHVGAFKDLAEEGIIWTYRDFGELVDILDGIVAGGIRMSRKRLESFLATNTWEHFGLQMKEWIV